MIGLLLLIHGLSFSPVSSWLLLTVLALLLILFVVRLYVRKDTGLDNLRRRLLMGLRIAAFMCIVLALLQPVVSIESKESHRPKVLVLVDGSASMSLPFDPTVGADLIRSRSDVALGTARALLKQLPHRFDSSVYVFSDSLRAVAKRSLPAEGVGAIKPATAAGNAPTGERGTHVAATGKPAGISSAPSAAMGSRTALGQALEDVSSGVGKTPAAVVVISDGASTFGPDPTAVARRISLPVYTVLSAKEGPFRDIEITEVLHPASGYAGSEAPVLVRVKGYGLENLNVPLSISEGETVVSRGMVKLAGSADTEVLLSFKPGSAGIHFYRVSIPAVKGEASTVNNSTAFAIEVLSEKLKILYLEGGITWDFTFLKRQLESDPKLQITFALLSGLKSPPTIRGFASSVPRGLGGSSVVLVGDGAARYLNPDTWKSLGNFVSSGGGLFVAGADGLGEVPESARRLLPAQLLKPNEWGPQNYLDCRVTFDGLNHPICDVEKESSSNSESWAEISPLLGSHVIGSAKPGASVLFESGTGDKSFPVVVAGSYGKGRVLLVAASGFWRWGFSVPGAGGSDRLFSGFTSNAIWWLSQGEGNKAFDFKPQSWVFQNGEEVTFSGGGAPKGTTDDTESGGHAGEESNFRIEVTGDGGGTIERAVTKTAGTDSLSADLGILSPGTYKYKVSDVKNGGRVSSSGTFTVDSNGPEHRNLFPDPRLLTYVSQASGGKSFTTDQVGALAREIATFGEKTIVERQVRLWNHPVLFLAFAMFVAIEWWLRRRSGLP